MTTLSFQDQLINELFDAQPQPVFWMQPMWDESGTEIIDFKYSYGNKEFFRAVSLHKEKIIGQRISNSPLLNQELKSRYLQQLKEVFLKDKKLEDTVYNPVLNTYFNFLRTKIQDGVLTVIQDRTYEYKIIGELEKATQQLRSLINASQSPMSLFRPVFNEIGEVVDFTFGTTNLAFAAYAGQTPDSVLGDAVSKWFPTYINNGLFYQYHQTYITGETIRQEKHYFGDGVDAWLDIMSTRMIDGVLITITDQTPMKKLQFELEHSIKALQGSNEQLEGFAYAASHDMKEPIRKIRTFANRLKISLQDRMREDEINLFNRMESSAERMQTLVDELLEYSQLSHTPKEKEWIDLGEKVQLVLQDLEMEIEEKKARIEVGPLPNIKGYKRQMQQLLQNLIGNALKYHKPGATPHIVIGAEIVIASEKYKELPADIMGKKLHHVWVRDNGIGFEQKYAKRIFGMFQRLHGRSEYSGTGVGLSIVQKVVDIHSGYIWAESEPGAGACFNLLFLEED